MLAFTGNEGDAKSIDDGYRISEDNPLGSKPLNGLEDNVRRSKLSGVNRPVHLDKKVISLS